jgi:hypothetical protein
MDTEKLTNVAARRRSDRILSPVRIRVIGSNASGISFAEETETISFNQQGARISLTQSLLPDDVVLIKNLKNDIEEEFRVVGGFQQVFGGRQEWGVEAMNPGSEIWGVKFAARAEGLEPKVLIECAACKTAAHGTLSSIEYEVLLSSGVITRYCERCRETTRWKPSAQVLTADIIASSARKVVVEGERRKTKRLKLTMRTRIRSVWGVYDIAQTRDVSKSGLCFVSNQRFQIGDEVYITLPFVDRQVPVESKAKIIWTFEGSEGRLYGVCYIKELSAPAGG